MDTDLAELITFVMEASETLPLKRRARIISALAEVCGDPEEEKSLRQLAATLADADTLCRQFNFSFVQKNKV